jgi:hypothetical protein
VSAAAVGRLLGLPTVGTAGSAIVLDGFDRPDSPNSLGSADTGQVWTAHAANWGISAGRAYLNPYSAGAYATLDAGVADGVVRVRLAVLSPGKSERLVFRFSDTNNHWLLQAVPGEYRLYKRVAGSFALVATAAVGPLSGDVVEARLAGPTIECRRNDGLLFSTSDGHNQAATRHGLSIGGAGNSSARWDDFSVTLQ